MYPFSFLQQSLFAIPSLILEFNSIANANLLVGDARDVSDWNDFFDLPTEGNPFTLVKVIGKKVYLVGGSDIYIKDFLFSINNSLVSIVDNANCVTSVGFYSFECCALAISFDFPAAINVWEGAFGLSPLVTSFNLPSAINIYNYCFEYCTSATFFNLQSCEELGYTVLNNNVFTDITGNTITLEVARPLLSCNGGSPDGDIQYLEANNTVTITSPLTLQFNDISNADLLVGDASNVADWNTFFDLPINGTPFNSVSIYNNSVKLVGVTGINLKESLFENNNNLLSIVDSGNYITSASAFCFYNCSSIKTISLPVLSSAGDNFSSACFSGCTSVTKFNLSQLTFAGDFCFYNCESVEVFDLPLLTTIKSNSFYGCTSVIYFNLGACTNLGGTVGNDNVFQNITGNFINIYIPASRMTCNGGNPDGDIQYLQANNTVTVITT
jgi:hypothetical protein